MPRRHAPAKAVTDRAATCPECRARFRVTPAQLIQRGGLVRCGDCRTVFDGFAALGPTDAQADQPAEAPTAPTPASPPRAAPAEGTLAETTLAPAEALLPARAAMASRNSVWRAGAALLGLALAAQASLAARAAIAEWQPATRPALESACRALGCTVDYRSHPEALKLEDAELIEMPGRAGQVSLQARIRNVAGSPQAFPHLELALRDATGNREVRRVLRPADYLGSDATGRPVLPAGGEALVNVRLESRGFKPTGYVLTLLRP